MFYLYSITCILSLVFYHLYFITCILSSADVALKNINVYSDCAMLLFLLTFYGACPFSKQTDNASSNCTTLCIQNDIVNNDLHIFVGIFSSGPIQI